MNKYNITGMSCAACQNRVEKAVSKVAGVDSVSVSLLTNSMQVEGNANEKDIFDAVKKAGYGISSAGGKSSKSDSTSIEDTQTPLIKKRLIASLVLLIPLMYISMGHMMFGWPLPEVISDNHVAMGLIQLLLTLFILIINQKFFINGIKGVINKSPNMDTLVALGAGASFIYSTCILFLMTDAVMKNNNDLVMTYMHDFYFESAAMIVTLITVGKMLESYSKGKTTNALKGLMDLAPKTATIIKTDENGNEYEETVSIDQVEKGCIFVVRPGESIPVDGIVIEGESAVDESAITGESIPVDKTEGSEVTSATINRSGFLKCRAKRVGEDTTLSQIINMVSEAASSKAPIAKIADKVSGIFVPVVIAIALVTIIVWLIAGKDIGFALARGISVLVISCPCALGLATPVAIMVGNGIGAKSGILFKNATALENAGKTKIVALDKTGTITSGKPQVTDVFTTNDTSRETLLNIAFSLESKSEHPLAKAVISYCEENNCEKSDVTEFSAVIGNGLLGKIQDKIYYAGNAKYISEKINVDKKSLSLSKELAVQGKTPVFVSNENKLLGIIAIADVIKDESAYAIKELEDMGINVVMITGDNENTAKAIGKIAGVDNVIAGVLPQGKESVISDLAKKGNTLMVGDGINDAPALTKADIGVAIGAGTDIAIDAADIVLMKSNLKDVPAAINLSKKVLQNIHENLFWAFIYNIIGIPLAAGVWYPMFGITLNPMFGAAAMSLSSFCVVTNALRLNLKDIYKIKKTNKSKINLTEEIKMDNSLKKVMEIEGMMCGHCEATVKNALEAVDGVETAEVSHEKNQAIVTLNKEVSDDVLVKAVEDKDYKVKSVK